MKKCFSFFAVAAMACCAVVSCDKDNSKDDGGSNAGNNPGTVPSVVKISIDGDFSDWDAITESSEDGTVYFCASGAEGYKNIRNLKVTSDPDYIYMCVEIATNKIKMAEGGHHGDSNEGAGFAWPYNPFWVYIDSDNNPNTGIITHFVGDIDTGGPVFSDFAADNFVQVYNWIATETGIWDMAWSQINFKDVVVEDGDSIDNCYKWPASALCPNGLGWAPSLDNLFVTFENFKTKINGGWAICEFAIDRAQLFNNNSEQGTEMTEIAFGLANQSGNPEGATGWSGIIPGDRKPAVLKLINR